MEQTLPKKIEKELNINRTVPKFEKIGKFCRAGIGINNFFGS